MLVETCSRLLDLHRTWYCICFVLSMLYVQCVQSTGADLQIREKHLLIIRCSQKTFKY